MRVSWLRRLTGRSLLRERSRQRSRPIGECARCGIVLIGPTECWLDAERVVSEHALVCSPSRPRIAVPDDARAPRPILRSA